ncbi:YdeI/OmpD-associated family protein [Nocardia sp. NPDC051570]|uniref:YdeI/OmpD-associated family protein n=1 Tax=Nocardia sp. NPDC051570 TaxID=3364324 RepID=UPI003795372B
MQRFEARIETVPGGGAYVRVPAEVIANLGGGGRIPVRASFDGIDYAGSIASMGDGPCLGMLKSIRTALGKGPGDTVAVTVARDTEERTVEPPQDLAAALAAAGLRTAFDEQSFTRRREQVEAVTAAKRADTRERRIAKTIELLQEDSR